MEMRIRYLNFFSSTETYRKTSSFPSFGGLSQRIVDMDSRNLHRGAFCSALNCNNTKRHCPGLSFFHFLSDVSVVFGVLLLERYLVDGLHASILLQLIYTHFNDVLIILIYKHDISTLHPSFP